MLVKGAISVKLVDFITNKQKEVVTDTPKAILEFSEMLEELIYDAIKSHEHIIATGVLAVTTAGTPAAQAGANPAPVILGEATNEII